MTATCGDEEWSRLIAATAAVIARKGYADTRIADIAHEADVPLAAVFGRFRSKNDLLRQALVASVSGMWRCGATSRQQNDLG